MSMSPIWVEKNFSIKQMTRLIFTTKTPGFPVVEKGKVVGFIAEEDIYLKIYNFQEDGSKGKKSLADILDKKVEDFMIHDVISVNPETPLIEAQKILYELNLFQLPVIDKNKKLVGALTRGDVFRYVLEDEIPSLEQSEFVSFLEVNYDKMINWDERFEYEFPTLFRIFNREGVKKVLDLEVWTGEYSFGLAKEGINVLGVDHNPSLINLCNEKRAKQTEKIKKNVKFELSDYSGKDTLIAGQKFDAVISMGGSLPYLENDVDKLLKSVYKSINENGVFVLQLMNLERIMKQKNGFSYFRRKNSETEENQQELYVEFFDRKSEDILRQHIISLFFDGKRWVYRGVNSVNINYLRNRNIEGMLREAGFKDISITGNKSDPDGDYGHMSLIKPFDPVSSDWMTIVAVKK